MAYTIAKAASIPGMTEIRIAARTENTADLGVKVGRGFFNYDR
jgi:hypothetical protein